MEIRKPTDNLTVSNNLNSIKDANISENEHKLFTENYKYNNQVNYINENKSERQGDWNCSKCKNLNFSFRVKCNKCLITKEESENILRNNLINNANNNVFATNLLQNTTTMEKGLQNLCMYNSKNNNSKKLLAYNKQLIYPVENINSNLIKQTNNNQYNPICNNINNFNVLSNYNNNNIRYNNLTTNIPINNYFNSSFNKEINDNNKNRINYNSFYSNIDLNASKYENILNVTKNLKVNGYNYCNYSSLKK